SPTVSGSSLQTRRPRSFRPPANSPFRPFGDAAGRNVLPAVQNSKRVSARSRAQRNSDPDHTGEERIGPTRWSMQHGPPIAEAGALPGETEGKPRLSNVTWITFATLNLS